MPKFIDATPPPKNHLGTLSRVGYSFNAAVADIVDNSIAANASVIDIVFITHIDKPIFYISDNGSGMGPSELTANMVIGCKDPDEEREIGDLGRFGAGLKTASFSQAKTLTVCSWQDGNAIAAVKWDTDLVKRENSWMLQVLDSDEIVTIPGVENRISQDSGTFVLWEGLTGLDESLGLQNLPHQIAKYCFELSEYLSLHFHRFIGKSLVIRVNGKKLIPLDPFMKDIKGYEEGPSHYLRAKNSKIVIQSHILPRMENLTHEQLDRHGGAKEIARKQGLYIYRDKRLILAGGWYGLATHDELGKLTRIQIDVPASLDFEWKTDVKKSTVKIPPKIKQILKRVIPSPKKRSIQVQKYKGRQEEESEFWSVLVNELDNRSTTSYVVNPDNKDLKDLYGELSKEGKRRLAKYLLELSATLPINHIYSTKAEQPNSILLANVDDELEKLLESLK